MLHRATRISIIVADTVSEHPNSSAGPFSVKLSALNLAQTFAIVLLNARSGLQNSKSIPILVERCWLRQLCELDTERLFLQLATTACCCVREMHLICGRL